MDPNVLHNLSYGMYIVSSNKGDLLNAQIANTVFQITSEPVTIAISINNKNLTHEYIESSSRFSLSILDENTPLSFIGKFGFKSGRTENKTLIPTDMFGVKTTGTILAISSILPLASLIPIIFLIWLSRITVSAEIEVTVREGTL